MKPVSLLANLLPLRWLVALVAIGILHSLLPVLLLRVAYLAVSERVA